MSIPQLQQNGLLPSGVHDCTIEDIRTTFTWNQHRQQLFDSFVNFLKTELRPLFPDPIYFDGSFVTDKVTPDDTDVVLDLTNAPDERKWRGLQFMKEHQTRIRSDYGVHFWVNLPGNSDFAEFFQYVGVKTARAKGLHPLHYKGILRVA